MFVGQGILLKPLLDRALQESSRTSEEAPFAEQLHKLKADYIRLAEPTAVTNQDADILAHGAPIYLPAHWTPARYLSRRWTTLLIGISTIFIPGFQCSTCNASAQA